MGYLNVLLGLLIALAAPQGILCLKSHALGDRRLHGFVRFAIAAHRFGS